MYKGDFYFVSEVRDLSTQTIAVSIVERGEVRYVITFNLIKNRTEFAYYVDSVGLLIEEDISESEEIALDYLLHKYYKPVFKTDPQE